MGSIVYSMGNFLFPERLIAPPKVTYYSEEPIDYTTLPVTDKYPIVDCVTLKTLPYWARVGMVVSAQIDSGTVRSKYRYTYLDKNNCLVLLDEERSKDAANKLKWLSCLLRWRLYKLYVLVRRAISRFKRLLIKK